MNGISGPTRTMPLVSFKMSCNRHLRSRSTTFPKISSQNLFIWKRRVCVAHRKAATGDSRVPSPARGGQHEKVMRRFRRGSEWKLQVLREAIAFHGGRQSGGCKSRFNSPSDPFLAENLRWRDVSRGWLQVLRAQLRVRRQLPDASEFHRSCRRSEPL